MDEHSNTKAAVSAIARRAINGDPSKRLLAMRVFVEAVRHKRPVPPAILEAVAAMLEGIEVVDFKNTKTRGNQLLRAMGLDIRKDKQYERDQDIEDAFVVWTELIGISETKAILQLEKERQGKEKIDSADYDGTVRRVLRARGMIGDSRTPD